MISHRAARRPSGGTHPTAPLVLRKLEGLGGVTVDGTLKQRGEQ